MSDSCGGSTNLGRDQPPCCDDCPIYDDCANKGECGAIHALYPVGKPSLITIAEKLPVFAAKIVTDWLSSQPGNADFEERFHYAMGVKPPEWLDEWDEEHIHKHEYYFLDWIKRTKKELGLE